MNENPGDTPNPLNPNTNEAPKPQEPVVQSVSVESLDPDGRPMEKVSPTAGPARKGKVGLIIGIIVGAIVLIGGAAAAAVLLNMKKIDAVSMAMHKIMNGDAPSNVAIDGEINILNNQVGSPIKRINVNLDSDIIVGSMINTSSAVLTFTTYNDKDYSVHFDEVYAANGDLYFKIEGATAALEDSHLLDLLYGSVKTVTDCSGDETSCVEETDANCVTDADGSTNCTEQNEIYSYESSPMFSGIMDTFKVVDGVWLKISTEEINFLGQSVGTKNSITSCVTNLVSDLNKNSNATAELYNKYPFIVSTTEGVTVPSKGNPVYQVSIDSEKFTNYVNAMDKTKLTTDLYTCLELDDNVSVDEAEMEKIIANLPKVYVEVNGNYDFVRLYTETNADEQNATITLDLGFSYPTNINASEPVEYTNFSEVINQIMSGFFNISGTEPEVVEVKAN